MEWWPRQAKPRPRAHKMMIGDRKGLKRHEEKAKNSSQGAMSPGLGTHFLPVAWSGEPRQL